MPIASPQSEGARQAGAEATNGHGFYRFKIGDFQATMISDGYGQIPDRPIFVMNAYLSPMNCTSGPSRFPMPSGTSFDHRAALEPLAVRMEKEVPLRMNRSR
jgi:hypothetical protein